MKIVVSLLLGFVVLAVAVGALIAQCPGGVCPQNYAPSYSYAPAYSYPMSPPSYAPSYSYARPPQSYAPAYGYARPTYNYGPPMGLPYYGSPYRNDPNGGGGGCYGAEPGGGGCQGGDGFPSGGGFQAGYNAPPDQSRFIGYAPDGLPIYRAR